MKRFVSLTIFCCILLLAGILRLWQLGAIPPSPDWDEAALGYNAYSILKTGRDEYGTFFPLSIRSFDDYKPPLYVFLTVPSVAVFGLSVFAVRLPSALFGILAVAGVFFLVKILIYNAKKTYQKNDVIMGLPADTLDMLPYVTGLFLAISPWHIQFSRIAFEANLGVTINIWAVYFFIRGLYSRKGFIISAVLFSLAMYAYHSERIFVPSLVVFLFIIYRKYIFPEKEKIIITAGIVGLLVILPLIPVLMDKSTLTRLKGTSSFREQTVLLGSTIKKLEYDKSHGYLLGMLFDNRRVDYVKTIINGYLSHFSLKWLFVTGDHERHHAPDMGLLYFWELPFILIGLYRLVRGRGSSDKLFLGWFLLAPIAASPTTQLPHAIRTLVFLPTFQVFSAIGVLTSFSYIRVRFPKLRIPFYVCFGIVAVGTFIYYTHMYFVHMNKEYSKFWQYGYKQAVAYAEEHKNEYKKIVVSTDLEQPYIFFLFYTKMDPKTYLDQGGTISGSFDEKYNHFNTYEFRKIDWPNEIRDGHTLYIGTPGEIVHGNKANITYLDRSPAINITDRE
jgi:4-amino-4-deoxy-L-arabinose transferase-like glycosyltransferase